MDSNINDLLNTIIENFENISYVKSEDIPNIELYMDQVTTFMDNRLRKFSRNPEVDKVMTKTMINNYAKNDLLPSPVKKKYSREHILILLFIYYFKSFLSISDIQTILEPITSKYFDKDAKFSVKDIYDEIVSLEKSQIDDIKEDVIRQYKMSASTFDDANVDEQDKEFLKTFSFICALSFDLYVKQSIIEKLIDELRENKENN